MEISREFFAVWVQSMLSKSICVTIHTHQPETVSQESLYNGIAARVNGSQPPGLRLILFLSILFIAC